MNATRECSVPECGNRVDAARSRSGYCLPHYNRWHRTGNPLKSCEKCGRDVGFKYTGLARFCSEQCKPRCLAEDCDVARRGDKYCQRHSAHVRRHGSLDIAPKQIWGTQWVCVVCGSEVEKGTGRRSHCSSQCQSMESRNRCRGLPPAAATRECNRCGIEIDLWERNGAGRKRRSDIQLCIPCKRANARPHKMSTNYLFRRDGSECRICDMSIDMSLEYPDMMRASVDHIHPYSLGGSHDEENLQLAHLRCNLTKQKRVGFKIAR